MLNQRHARIRTRRSAAVVAVAAAALLAPLVGVSAAQAATAPASAEHSAKALPPGVFALPDSAPCPSGLLCLYRDYGAQGPAYGIRPGLPVDLRQLPMDGAPYTDSKSAANNVSTWVNRTQLAVTLLDDVSLRFRIVRPGQTLSEPQEYNDTVDSLGWL